MDPGLEVEEAPGQVDRRRTPVQPEVVRGHAHHQGAHAEVEPARGPHRPQAGIDHGEADPPLTPGLKALLAFFGFGEGLAQAVVNRVEVLELDARLVLELLHEVAMPPQARLEAREGAGPTAVQRLSGAEHRPQGLLPVPGRLVHRAHGDAAPGEVGTETRASRPGGEGARHFRAVADAALFQETPQHFPSRRLAAALEFDRNHRTQAQLLRTQNSVGDQASRAPGSEHLRG